MEIRVQIDRHENDCYVEVWKVVGERKYFARYVYGRPIWYFVCDPHGYCELDHACPDSYVFIVCDQRGKELFRSSNGDPNSSFPTLSACIKEEWQKIHGDLGACRDGFRDWLLSYMTPENLAKDPETTQFCPEDNWVWCWHDRVEAKSVCDFEYLGEPYCIWAVTYKHRYCDCVWVEYLSGNKHMDWEYPWFMEHHGYCFPQHTHGPMYSRSQAIEIVSAALKEIYETDYSLSYVNEQSWDGLPHEQKMTVRAAAEKLIGNDLSRKNVDTLTTAEWDCRHFYAKTSLAKAVYPDLVVDYHSRLWW